MNKDINVNVSGPIQPISTYKTKVLKGNHSFASQVTEPNMKYVIKYDFDLGGEEITIPEGCLLEFDGGSLSNGNISGLLNIVASDYKIFDNISFNAAKCNNLMNICWWGAIGDYVSDADYTDNTSAIQAALDSQLGLYIPEGKFGVAGNLVIPTGSNRYDSATNYAFKSIKGAGIRHSWLVACGNKPNDNFISCDWFDGEITQFYITTGTNSRRKNGIYITRLIADGRLDLSIRGFFDWCGYFEGGVQNNKIKLQCTLIPEANARTNPDNGFYFGFTYAHGADMYILVEYIKSSGTCLVVNNPYGIDNKLTFLVESTHNTDVHSAVINATGFLITKSYTECDHYPVLNSCKDMFITHCNTIWNMQGCTNITMVNTTIDSSSMNNKEIHCFGAQGYDAGLSFSSNSIFIHSTHSSLHNNYYGAGLDLGKYKNVISNKANNQSSNYNNKFVLTGKGYSDNTRYIGMNTAFKCTVSNLGSRGYTFLINDSREIDNLKIRRTFTVSYVFKPANIEDVPKARIGMNGVNGYLTYGCLTKPLADGWIQAVRLMNLSAEDSKIDWNNFMVSPIVNKAGNVGMEYYVTNVMVVPGPNVPLAFECCNGEDFDVNVPISGISSKRPVNVGVGTYYFDTSISPARPIYWNGTAWVDATGATV